MRQARSWHFPAHAGPIVQVLPILSLLLVLVPGWCAAGTYHVTTRWIRFCWTSSPLVDSQGNAHAPAVAYRVYLKEGYGPVHFIGTVPDTVCCMRLDPYTESRVMVIGVDAQGRLGIASPLSDPIVVTGLEGVQSAPPAPVLHQNYPNPFNPSTTLSYDLPADLGFAAPVALEIYDVQGKRIRLFRQLDGSAGSHAVAWDGRDDAGRPQPTGQYLAVLRCGSDTRLVKMTLMK
jgi:hypothetical protein